MRRKTRLASADLDEMERVGRQGMRLIKREAAETKAASAAGKKSSFLSLGSSKPGGHPDHVDTAQGKSTRTNEKCRLACEKYAASLLHPGIAALSRALGRAAAGASAAELERLGRLHWFTLEFGVVDERGAPRAVGAGLLSSPGELARFASAAELLDYDPGRAAETPYDPTDYQPRLFAAPSLAELVGRANRWVRRGAWRDRSATISAGGPGPAGPRYGGDPGRALPAARPLPREKGPSPCAPASSPPRSSP